MSDPDFDRIFAENGAKDTLSNSDYDGGWDDIAGALPPTKEQFNAISNELDSKSKWLRENLPIDNLLINGGFDVWQRGVSGFTAASDYTADRWVVTKGAGATSETRRETLSFSASEIVGSSQVLVWDKTVAGTGAGWVGQRMENVVATSNVEVTLSFWARTFQSATVDLGIDLLQNFGSGGSTQVVTSGVADIGTIGNGTWVKHEATFTFPTVDGKTIGDGNYAAILISPDAAGVFELQIASVKLEIGNVATPYQARPIGEELALCQRYFYRLSSPYEAWVSKSTTNDLNRASVYNFPVEMRITPAITNFTYGTGWFVPPILTPYRQHLSLIGVVNTASIGANIFGWDADAEL